MEPLIQAGEGGVADQAQMAHLAVQVLSFFATPAQFNISLVAQLLLEVVMLSTPLPRLELWLQQRQHF